MTERKGDWMQTFTGRQYWPLDPRADEVDPVDIAHHLSMICRYCGASTRFYSVAEHTLGVLYVGLREADRRLPAFARYSRLVIAALLLHDAAEAYCHDLIRPIKRSVVGYDEIEPLNMLAILQRFRLDPLDIHCFVELMKRADNAMLLAEQAALMKPAPAQWMPVVVPDAMVRDAARYLRLNRWMPWRKWRWWVKREMLRQMRRVGLV